MCASTAALMSYLFALPAAPLITTPPVNVTVVAPDEAVFTCSAEGFPLPSVSWRRFNTNGLEIVLTEGGNIMVSNSSTTFTTTSNLTLSPTDHTLNGVYACTATNDVGSVNASAVLTVNGEKDNYDLYDVNLLLDSLVQLLLCFWWTLLRMCWLSVVMSSL